MYIYLAVQIAPTTECSSTTIGLRIACLRLAGQTSREMVEAAQLDRADCQRTRCGHSGNVAHIANAINDMCVAIRMSTPISDT